MAEGCVESRGQGQKDIASEVWGKPTWSEGADESHEDLLGTGNAVVISTETEVFKETPEGRSVTVLLGAAAVKSVGDGRKHTLREFW